MPQSTDPLHCEMTRMLWPMQYVDTSQMELHAIRGHVYYPAWQPDPDIVFKWLQYGNAGCRLNMRNYNDTFGTQIGWLNDRLDGADDVLVLNQRRCCSGYTACWNSPKTRWRVKVHSSVSMKVRRPIIRVYSICDNSQKPEPLSTLVTLACN